VIVLVQVGLGGALGAISRYLLSIYIESIGYNNQISIFVVNIIGALVAGFCITTLELNIESKFFQTFFIIGFLASFTTFSTIAVATDQLFLRGQYLFGLINLTGNIVFGLAAGLVGIMIGKVIN
tara:strand:- start:210 stop:581 length:372 start_codon:yes stop_codon:yes gene_type:complete